MRPARSTPTGVLGAIRSVMIRARRDSRVRAGSTRLANAMHPARLHDTGPRLWRSLRRRAAGARFALAGRLAGRWARPRTAAVARRVIVRQAEEQRQIGLSLYAGPAQLLSLALLRLDALAARHPPGSRDGLGNDLELATRAVADGLSEMRAIASSIRTPDLDALDVSGVVERALHVGRPGLSSGVSVRIVVPLPVVSVEVKTIVFQIVRSLAAVIAEDPRTSVELSLSASDRSLDLSARADIGTVSDEPGWTGIRDRAELIGGSIRMEPAPAGGFTLEAALPVRVGPEHSPSRTIPAIPGFSHRPPAGARRPRCGPGGGSPPA